VVPARRTRTAPVVGAVVLYVAGALLTAGQGDRGGAAALVVVLLLAAGWVLLPGAARERRDAPDAPDAPGAPAALAAPAAPAAPAHAQGRLVGVLTAVLAASFALVAAALPTAGAFEPRALVPPPSLPASATNPVPQVAAWNQRADLTLFTVAPGGEPLPER